MKNAGLLIAALTATALLTGCFSAEYMAPARKEWDQKQQVAQEEQRQIAEALERERLHTAQANKTAKQNGMPRNCGQLKTQVIKSELQMM